MLNRLNINFYLIIFIRMAMRYVIILQDMGQEIQVDSEYLQKAVSVDILNLFL